MELGLSGKNVFITASTGGIGRAVAEAFLKEGASVILNGRNEDKLKSVCSGFCDRYGRDKVYAVCGDMSDDMEIKKAVSDIKNYVSHIDIAVGNLGTGKPISDDKFNLEEWKYMLKTNLLSAVGLIENVRDIFSDCGGRLY